MAKLETVGKVTLPFPYYGTIVGTYTDDTTRIIDVTVGIPEGSTKLPPFPNQPLGLAFLEDTDPDTIYVGIKSAERDPNNSDQLIVTIDRGYMYDVIEDPQPVSYGIPLTGGKLGISDAVSAGMEASEWSKAAHQVVIKLAAGDGIIPAKLSAFEVIATNPASMHVIVGTGVAAVDDGLIYQEAAESVLIEPTWTLPAQAGYHMKARVYLKPVNGEIGVVYGTAVVGAANAPTYPSGVIKLAVIALTQAATPTIVNGSITTERVLA